MKTTIIKNIKYDRKLQYVITLLFLFSIISINSTNAQTAGMWMQQSTNDTNYTYNSVYFDNFLTGWVCGTHGKIFKTVNGGYNWTQQLTNSYENYLQKIVGVPGTQYVFACGYVNNSSPSAAVILQTSNGGTIWTNNTINYLNFKNVSFINGFTGFIIGSRTDSLNTGRIYRTTNGGGGAGVTNYDSYPDGPILHLGTFKAISFINTNTGWITATNAITNNTTLIKTTNMGVNWNITGSTINGIYINDIKFIDVNTGWACGGAVGGTSAKILKTTNGGVTWSVQSFINSNMFNSMSWVPFFGPTAMTYRGFICGENGQVYVSYDYGNTWLQQTTPNINNLNGIYFTDANVGWAVGNNADIIATYHGGVLVNNISTTVPSSYKVYQNYPNPFNPTTTIKFDILKSDFVKMEVFDGLGRKIDELVNERLQPGSYSVEWNASSRSSGIYYYRISTADFTKTMKMTLVK